MLSRLAAAASFRLGRSAAAVGPIGPECSGPVKAAVLAAVEGRVAPGTVVQYLQIIKIDGQYQVQLCTVTVPSEPQP